MGKSGKDIKWNPITKRYEIPGMIVEEEEAPPPPPKMSVKKTEKKEEKKQTNRYASSFIEVSDNNLDQDSNFKPPPIDDVFNQPSKPVAFKVEVDEEGVEEVKEEEPEPIETPKSESNYYERE